MGLALEEILSDLVSRIQKLEQTPRVSNVSKFVANSEIVYLETPTEIYNHSITATETAWADSTSGKYIPSDAKKAIIFAYVDGTSDATGLNKVEARGGGLTVPILAIYEEGGTSAPSCCNTCEVPLSNGRFDLKATIGSGRTSGSFDFVVVLLGYVK